MCFGVELKKLVVCGLAASVVFTIVGFAIGFFTSGFYVGAIWKMAEGWQYWMLSADVVAGFLFAFAFLAFKSSLRELKYKSGFKGLTRFEGGRCFGLMLWIAAAFPGLFFTYATMEVPLNVILSWMLSSLLQMTIGGSVIERVEART